MKKLLIFLILLMFFSPLVLSPQEVSDKIHYVLVIDKTKSMIGQGDGYGNNIWGDVLSASIDFIDNLSNKGKVSIYTYADATSERTTFDLERSNSKEEIKQFISSIIIDGNFTAIYDAMDKVFKELVKPDTKEPVLIYLFTDGKDNRSRMDFENILKFYNANRTDYINAYYIKLRGNIDSELKTKLQDTKGIEILEIPEVPVFPITLQPNFSKLSYNLPLNNQQKQTFKIIGQPLSQGFKFDANLSVKDPELGSISLSKRSGYTFSGENNEVNFEFKISGSLNAESGKIYRGKIRLSNPDDGQHKISFAPDEFDVEVTNNPPRVIVKQSWGKK